MMIANLWWAYLASILGSAMSMNYCEPPPKPYRGSQPLPVFSSQATADIQVHNRITDSVWNMELFYTPNRVKLDVFDDKGGLIYTVQVNSATEEVFFIKGTECNRTSLYNIPQYDEEKFYIIKFVLFGKQSLTDVLRFSGNVNMEYKGQLVETDVSLKPLHHWYTCLKSTNMLATGHGSWFSLDYFLVVHNDSQVPHMARPMALRVESANFALEMNITRYEPTISQPLKTFSIPRDVVCPGTNATLGFSTLGEHYYYEEQVISQSNKHLSYNKIWYSHDRNLSRVDYTKNHTRVTEIHNYNDGIAYYINQKSGSCRLKLIRSDDSDEIPQNHQDDDGLVVGRNSMKFTKLDLLYHYQGKEYIQGMLCRVYRTRRKGDQAGNQTSPAHIYTYYFFHRNLVCIYDCQPNWRNETVDLATSMDLVPVMLIIRKGQNETRYRFLNFRREKPDYAVFDVSPCIPSDRSLSLAFTIPAPYTPAIAAVVARTARVKLVELTRIEPQHIQNIHITHDEIAIHLWTTILTMHNDMGSMDAAGPVPVNYIHEYMALRSLVNSGNLTFDATFTVDKKQIPVVAAKVDLTHGMLHSSVLPAFPTKMSYAMVSEQFQLVRNSRVFYDHINKIVIAESRDPYIFWWEREVDMFGTIVMDVAMGVKYNIDRRNKNCKIMLAQDRLVAGNSKNPIAFLAEPNLYKWRGQTTVRGVLCDIFKSEMLVTVDAEKYTLIFMLETDNKQYIFDFFEFETDFDATKIDLSPCYHGDDKRRIVITFSVPADISQFTTSTQRLFKEKFRVLMTTMFNLTALAMAGDVIDTDERHVYYYVTLLQRSEVNGNDAEPILNVYISLVNSIYRRELSLLVPTGTKTVRVFASGIATIDPQLGFVDVQPGDGTLSAMAPLNMKQFTESWQANVSASVTEVAVSNTSVEGCSTACLQSTIHECRAFVYCYNDFTCVLLNERRIPYNLPARASCTTYLKNYIEDYILLRGTVTQVGVSVTVVNAEGCARFCTNTEGCESVNFCPNTRACITSKRHDVLVAMPGGGSECQSYTRRYFTPTTPAPSATRTETIPTMYSTVLPSNRSQSQTSKRYSPGVMAGTAVGMLVLGLIIPSLVIRLIFTRRRIANNTMALETLQSTR